MGKLISIVDEEMERAGGQKIHLPNLLSSDLWRKSGRWDAAGPELMRLKDRHGNEHCLAPTHEEPVTALVAAEISSYKSLPLKLYPTNGIPLSPEGMPSLLLYIRLVQSSETRSDLDLDSYEHVSLL